jgi:hypothetical protein
VDTHVLDNGSGLNYFGVGLLCKVRVVDVASNAADKALKEDVRKLLSIMRAEKALQSPGSPVQSSSANVVQNPHGNVGDRTQMSQDAVCIISNDLGFDALLRDCRDAGFRTVAISNEASSPYRHADLLLSWHMVQSGIF